VALPGLVVVPLVGGGVGSFGAGGVLVTFGPGDFGFSGFRVGVGNYGFAIAAPVVSTEDLDTSCAVIYPTRRTAAFDEGAMMGT
jgi:hypothetical protein